MTTIRTRSRKRTQRDTEPRSFGALVKQHRLRVGLSQARLATLLNYDQSLLSRIERGERDPSPQLIEALSIALEIGPREIEELQRVGLRASTGRFLPVDTEWSLAIRPILRRILYWFISGSLLFLFFFVFILVRLFMIQRNVVYLHDLLAPDYLAPHALTLFLAGCFALLISVTIGFLIHQIYFAIYWSSLYWPLGVRARSGHNFDRALPVLSELAQEHGIDYERSFNQPLIADPKSMSDAHRNWTLLVRVWRDTITRGRVEYLDALVGLKEDTFSLQGASMISTVIAFSLYLVYDLSSHWTQLQAGEVAYLLAVIPNSLLLSMLVVVFRKVRFQQGQDASETRRLFLHLTYERLPQPSQK